MSNVISIDDLNDKYTADFENGKLFSKRNGREVGGVCPTGGHTPYLRVSMNKNGKQYNLYVHRILMAMNLGEWPEAVNHKDGNTLNNRADNIEAVNQLTNMRNRAPNKNASKYGRGIGSFDRPNAPAYWRLAISGNGKVNVWHFRKDRHSLLEVQLESVKRYHELGYTDRHIEQTLKAIEANPEYAALRKSLAA
ncbi:HNH endonuclease [Pseudogemmobacter bohemicus]|uniref:HNH endonuclease n=1 Tax=Pseudogemmobacter bohemicus TaxID=2250708 RepID=UPI000DD42466|nr:HNH endonuclease [Pseudogemmobacter bohemicus]